MSKHPPSTAPKKPKDRTCITILTWNRLSVLQKTLAGFFKHNGKKYPMLFLDNGSTDGTPEWLKSQGYPTICLPKNLGVFDGTMEVWKEAHRLRYDFILNLQDDFPNIAPIPFGTLEKFLDQEKDVGYIRLNDKKDQPKNIVTGKPIVLGSKIKLEGCRFRKYNYHATFNPTLMRTWLVPIFHTNQGKHRERGLMEKFNETSLLAARIYPPIFKTLPMRPREDGWKN